MGCLASALRGNPPPMAGSKPPPQRQSSLQRIMSFRRSSNGAGRAGAGGATNPYAQAVAAGHQPAVPAVPSRKASGLIKAKTGEYTPELAAALSELPANAVADPQVSVMFSWWWRIRRRP